MQTVDSVLGIVTLQLDGGPVRQLPARYAAEYLEHGYALTGHAAQGLTVDRAFVLVRAEGALAEWGYVAASRARTETRLYAVGPELVDDAGHTRVDPEAATRRLAGALSRTATGPPATQLAGSKRERLGSAQVARERLAREIESRERLLESTQRRLGGLGWIGRRRHGPAIREQMDSQQRVLADLRMQLRDLPSRKSLGSPPVVRSTPSRTRERAIGRRIERGMGLER